MENSLVENQRELTAVMLPQSFQEALTFSDYISKSDLAPKDYKGKPHNVLVAIQMGAEVGLAPMQAIQNIAVINGRPSLWGDAMLAVCMPHLQKFTESFDKSTMTATCKALRNGEWTTSEFSKEDAEKAGLWKKAGPWQQYPKRMLKLRARGFALRDSCPDILKGIQSAEESNDIIDAEIAERNPVRIEDEAVKKERAKEKPLLVKDHEGFANLKDLVDKMDLHDELDALVNGKWSEITINRFTALLKYVMDKEKQK